MPWQYRSIIASAVCVGVLLAARSITPAPALLHAQESVNSSEFDLRSHSARRTPPAPHVRSEPVKSAGSLVELWGGQRDTPQLNSNATEPDATEQSRAAGAPCSAVGCYSNSSNENEDCLVGVYDTVNSGCSGWPPFRATPLAPFQLICGQSWVYHEPPDVYFDSDWYITSLDFGDSVTWRVTAEFPFDYYVKRSPESCFGEDIVASGSGTACDTITVSLRATQATYAFGIFPSTSGYTQMLCETGPWNYHISLVKHCDIPCPPGAVDEGEGCSLDPSIDNFNGGCFSSPAVYSTITSGQPVCGQVSSANSYRDTDWYRLASPLQVGDVVSWAVSADFPSVIAIFDQRHGCITREVGGALSDACVPSLVEWTVDSAGIYTFIVGTQQSDHGYPCEEGPWNYTATLRVCTFGCASGGTPEGEVCDEYGTNSNDCYNPQPISLGERICGQAWRGQLPGCDPDPGYECEIYRDTDWYIYDATAGEVLTWTVRAEFGVDIAVIEWPDGTDLCAAWFYPTWTFNACDPVSVTYQVPDDGPVIFYVAPVNPGTPNPEYPCDAGPWEYEAIIESAGCDCDCAHDPQCDGEIDIFDVTSAVNVAFRNAAAMPDPNVACPWDKTDVNCDGVTDVFDVTKFVNVAFRNDDPATAFCNPCE